MPKEKKTPRWRRHNDKLKFLFMDLTDYLMARLDECSNNSEFDITCQMVRDWIHDFHTSEFLINE